VLKEGGRPYNDHNAETAKATDAEIMDAYDLTTLTTLSPWSIDELQKAITKTGKGVGFLSLAGKRIPCFKQGKRWIVWRESWEQALTEETAPQRERPIVRQSKPKRPATVGRRYTW
jgi:hypothetical protein